MIKKYGGRDEKHILLHVRGYAFFYDDVHASDYNQSKRLVCSDEDRAVRSAVPVDGYTSSWRLVSFMKRGSGTAQVRRPVGWPAIGREAVLTNARVALRLSNTLHLPAGLLMSNRPQWAMNVL